MKTLENILVVVLGVCACMLLMSVVGYNPHQYTAIEQSWLIEIGMGSAFGILMCCLVEKEEMSK